MFHFWFFFFPRKIYIAALYTYTETPCKNIARNYIRNTQIKNIRTSIYLVEIQLEQYIISGKKWYKNGKLVFKKSYFFHFLKRKLFSVPKEKYDVVQEKKIQWRQKMRHAKTWRLYVWMHWKFLGQLSLNLSIELYHPRSNFWFPPYPQEIKHNIHLFSFGKRWPYLHLVVP